MPNNLRFFSKKLNVDLSHFDKYKALILETFQRRHLLVHNGGIVNKQYLAKVDEGLVKEYALSVGNHILVSDQYLRRAIDRVHFTGVFLLQQCWRQWFKADASNADVALNTNLFDAIAETRYKLAQNLGDFARTVKISENATAMNILLNVAQSYKWDGNDAKCLDILNSHDWSGCGLLFKLALFALKGDADAFYELLPLAIAAKEIKEDQLREWPVFHGLRESPRFEENMARVVGQAT